MKLISIFEVKQRNKVSYILIPFISNTYQMHKILPFCRFDHKQICLLALKLTFLKTGDMRIYDLHIVVDHWSSGILFNDDVEQQLKLRNKIKLQEFKIYLMIKCFGVIVFIAV